MNAIALIESDTVNGEILFHQCRGHTGTIITINLFGPPNSVHAIHIHEYGDLTDGCTSLGGHWNPTHTTHGSFINIGQPRHAGDLINNVFFNNNGKFFYKYVDPLVKIPDIYGRSVVIHDGIDDLGLGENKESLETGNAGGRIACGIIGRKK